MNIEEIREYCLLKKGTTESFPFDEDVLVFKVMNKMFCLTSLSEGDRMNLKCDPERAIALREKYSCVLPGYHMNKQLWNTVVMDGQLSKKQLLAMIDDSYDLIVASLTKKLRKELEAL